MGGKARPPEGESNVVPSTQDVTKGSVASFAPLFLFVFYASIVFQQLAQHLHSVIGAQRDTAHQYRTTPSFLILGNSALSNRTSGATKKDTRTMICIEGGKRKREP